MPFLATSKAKTSSGEKRSSNVRVPDLLFQWHHDIVIDVPNDEEYVWLVDLSRDGKQDILMHYPSILRDGHGAPQRPPGTEAHRVTMLIA